MKIQDDRGVSRNISQGAVPVGKIRGEQSGGAKVSGWAGGDRFELSDQARAMLNAKDALDVSPQIREDKVISLKQEINDGTYHVPGETIAERMLGDGFLA